MFSVVGSAGPFQAGKSGPLLPLKVTILVSFCFLDWHAYVLNVQPQSTEARDQTRKVNGMAVAETTTEAGSSVQGNDSDVGRKAVGEARKVVSEVRVE